MYVPSADGGHAQYAHELLTALARHPRGGRRFELVSSADLRPRFRSELYPVHPILPSLADRGTFPSKANWMANRLVHYPRREWRFYQWLKSRPDVTAVHFQEWTPWLAAPLVRRVRRLGKRVYFTVHNVVPHRCPPMVPQAVMRGWIRRACRLTDGLFVLTDALAEELSRFLGEPHPPIRVAPHGVWTVDGLTAAPPTTAERLAWRKLLFFGALRRNKGLDLLLRAMELLPGYSLTIAGEALEARYVREEVLPLVARVRAVGAHVELYDRFISADEVGPLFASHSAIVLPYTRGFVAQSGVAFLAMAYELPVVASNSGGLRELLSEFAIGTTFEDMTPRALADAVRALEAEDVQAKLVSETRAAKRRYSWHAAASATLAGYSLAREARTETHDCAVETTTAA